MSNHADSMSAHRNNLAAFASVCAASIKRTFAAHIPLYICAVLFVPVTIAIAIVYRAPVSARVSLFFLEVAAHYSLVGFFIVAVAQYIRLARQRSRSPL